MKIFTTKNIVVLYCLYLLSMHTYANNIQISNISLMGQNTALDYTLVRFDISWDNSWRTSTLENNWDAAWIFMKYRKKGQTLCNNHMSINYVDGTAANDGHAQPAGSTITTPPDGRGVFIYRSAVGIGNISFTSVQLRWNYGVDGLVDGDSVEVCVYGIEMVYVPQNNFVIGSGGSSGGEFYTYPPPTTTTFPITSEAAINVGLTNGYLYYPASTAPGDQLGPIPASFPKGYNAFYCMKYEITQQQYVEFLNQLTYDQQATRTVTAPNSAAGTGALINPNAFRNGIDILTPGTSNTIPAVYACNLDGDAIYNEANDGQYIACITNWTDGAAYVDWAGLRPITELEYEKACRGTQTAVANEYAWGTTGATAVSGITNGGLTNEIATNAAANIVYNWVVGVQAPMRTGLFAKAASTRITPGSTYYGIMEMSGNLWEQAVSVGNPTGRGFTGTHGNGSLTANGNADNSDWPGYSGTEVTTALGSGIRGGCFDNSTVFIKVSVRTYAAYGDNTRGRYGFRGVRSAP